MRTMSLRALCGLGAAVLAASASAQAGDQVPMQTAALGDAATATVPADQLPVAPRIFVLASAVEDGALSARDRSALEGVVAAVKEDRPMLVSVTEIGTADGRPLARADAVRAWLVAHGVDDADITIAARDEAGSVPSEVALQDGQVRIALVE